MNVIMIGAAIGRPPQGAGKTIYRTRNAHPYRIPGSKNVAAQYFSNVQ